MSCDQNFPLYLMHIGTERRFMSIKDASCAFDSGWAVVEMGTDVLESDFSVRPVTEEEKQRIRNYADECSLSK